MCPCFCLRIATRRIGEVRGGYYLVTLFVERQKGYIIELISMRTSEILQHSDSYQDSRKVQKCGVKLVMVVKIQF
jgi:hypothetical protein